MVLFLLIIVLVLAFSYLGLRGENLSYLDSNIIPRPGGDASDAHREVVASLKGMSAAGKGVRGKKRVAMLREYMDSMSDGRDFESEFRTVNHKNLRGEWVLAPGVSPKRRLLYIHGGAWVIGSPKSHRSITNRLSKVADAAVFSLDYRLLPEHRRRDGIADCQQAYRWILANGPEGPEDLDFLAVAGDSAGGNLTLSVIAWARDEGLRAADAVIAFSPATDVTLTSPSLSRNIETDPMIGPAFGKLIKVPLIVLWWVSWFTNRINPAEAVVSPLRGDLSGLPPVLVQVSEAEMLYDDARRYVTKAQAAGSPVVLQSWPHMVHVWQIFNPELPEANDAYDNIAEFLESVEGKTLEQVHAA
ncbi:MAG: monoterpene epsilon-lactone hydrolase [Halioglobus sp.]|jgi:monoterpene epsilon-lactone hydrolase